MDRRETARRFFIQDPATLAQSYVNWAQRRHDEPGIKYGCVLDTAVIPLRPGDVMAVVARPGHGKSSFMAYLAKKTAMDIAARKSEDEVVVYTTWEQNAEEIDAFFQSGGDYSSTDMAWGRVPMDVIKRKAVKRPSLPLWIYGDSNRHEGIQRPPMTVDYVYESIQAMREEFNKRPVLMCMDYVQEIPIDGRKDKTEQVDQAIHEAKQLARRAGLPIVIGVQAKRDVDSYRNQIPTLADAQWASAIEQVADKQIALWRPSKTYDPAEHPTVSINGTDYKNDEDLFVIRLLKQRFEAGFGTWAIRFKPQTLEVYDYQYEPVNGKR